MSFRLRSSEGYLLLCALAFLPSVAFAFLYPNQFTFWLAAALGLLLYEAQKAADRGPFAALSCGLLISILVMPHVNDWVALVTPHTFDSALSQLCGGESVSFYHLVSRHWSIRVALVTVYESLTLFVCVCFLLSDRRSSFLRCFLLAALVAPLCYLVLPAVGPAHLGDPLAPRNCMPSLHITWTLLAIAFITPRFRWIGLPFLLLMMTAVIGIGEHYVIDIVAAIPYALGILWVEEFLRLRSPLSVARQTAPPSCVISQVAWSTPPAERRSVAEPPTG